MLEQISWSTYFSVIATLAVIYYLLIILLYYRKDIADVVNGKLSTKTEANGEAAAGRSNEVQNLEEIIAKIKGTLLESGAEAGKDELLTKLGQTLANFEGLQKPAFRVALTNYIIKQAKELCGVRFSEEELDSKWDSLLP